MPDEELPIGAPEEGDYRLLHSAGEGIYTPFAFRSLAAALYYMGVAHTVLDLTGKVAEEITLRRYVAGQWVDVTAEYASLLEDDMYDVKETL